MCLAIPARAKIELLGNVREADMSLVENPALGEWVLVHAGFAIEKLSEEDACETLNLLTQVEEGIGGLERT
jgi:hydrogenase expression/formation protein HypC